jgi:cytochrome c peroxidase
VRRIRIVIALAPLVVLAAIVYYAWQRYAPPAPWTAAERAQIRSLWIKALPPLPPDASNSVADDPRAVAFGHRLFFDERLSANGAISCATCHQPIRHFTDGLPRAVALGTAARNTPSIVGTAYSPWLYWDGRRDSHWAQALVPLEAAAEHGTTRAAVAAALSEDADYRRRYESLFGPLPEWPDDIDRVFANVGKALAAYERQLTPGTSRFDEYAAHLAADGDPLEQPYLDAREIRGLRLFIGEARCLECHNGPLFTNNEFHNTGLLSPPGERPERGRLDGLREALADPFNCAGAFSDDAGRSCPEHEFVRRGSELIGATRVPSLRNLENTSPFQSKGQFATLREVLDHYNAAPAAMIGHNEATALGLASWELDDLEAFLKSLAAPVDADPALLEPPGAGIALSPARR